MPRWALAFLVVGFVSAFFGFAGVSSSSPDVARWLFIASAIGFVISIGFEATVTRHAHRR